MPLSKVTVAGTCPILGQAQTLTLLEHGHSSVTSFSFSREINSRLFLNQGITYNASNCFHLLEKYLGGTPCVNRVLHISLQNGLVSLEYRVIVQLASQVVSKQGVSTVWGA